MTTETPVEQTGYYGEWLGRYSLNGHGAIDQLVKIAQFGPILRATKVTGNEFVPANFPTWDYNLVTKEARGYASEEGGKNTFTVPGKLVVINNNNLKFTWKFDSKESSVIFTRDA